MTISRNTKTAVSKYGLIRCLKALYENEVVGNGARTIAVDLGFASTGAADAAINAGRELAPLFCDSAAELASFVRGGVR